MTNIKRVGVPQRTVFASSRPSGAGGKRYATVVVGTTTSGHTIADCDYLCDGVADEVEINQALTAASPLWGRVLMLEGFYETTGTIIVSECELAGVGLASTYIARSDASADPVVQVASGAETVRDLAVGRTTAGSCIEVMSSGQVLLTGLFVNASSSSKAIYINGTDEVLISNCFFDTVGQYGVQIVGAANNVLIDGNRFRACVTGVGFGGSGTGCVVSGNIFTTGTTGVEVDQPSVVVVGNEFFNQTTYGIFADSACVITGNRINGTGSTTSGDGIRVTLAGTGATPQGTVISGNVIEDCFHGIRVSGSRFVDIVGNSIMCRTGYGSLGMFFGTTANRFCNISNNIISAAGTHGLSFGGNGDSDITIHGNSFNDCGLGTNNTWSTVELGSNSDRFNIQGNVFRHSAIYGANKADYCIDVSTSSCDNNVVTNNDFFGAYVTGGLRDAGTGTVTTAGNRV